MPRQTPLAAAKTMLRQLGQRARGFASAAEAPLKATLFPGDGVGPEIADAVTLVLKTAGVPIQWEVQVVKHDKPDPRTNSFVSRENLDSVKVRSRGHFWR
jgi:isocitrate dehydrogenase (NAD+)